MPPEPNEKQMARLREIAEHFYRTYYSIQTPTLRKVLDEIALTVWREAQEEVDKHRILAGTASAAVIKYKEEHKKVQQLEASLKQWTEFCRTYSYSDANDVCRELTDRCDAQLKAEVSLELAVKTLNQHSHIGIKNSISCSICQVLSTIRTAHPNLTEEKK